MLRRGPHLRVAADGAHRQLEVPADAHLRLTRERLHLRMGVEDEEQVHNAGPEQEPEAPGHPPAATGGGGV